jgi:hypothetical protein
MVRRGKRKILIAVCFVSVGGVLFSWTRGGGESQYGERPVSGDMALPRLAKNVPLARGKTYHVAKQFPNVPIFVTQPAGPDPVANNRLTSDDLMPSLELFKTELRNPHWAPLMENNIKQVFGSEKTEKYGLHGMELSFVECRERSCKLTIRYPKHLYGMLDSLGLHGETPPSILVLAEGIFAPWATLVEQRDSAALPGYEEQDALVAFTTESIDPENLHVWRQQEFEEMKENYPNMLWGKIPAVAKR